MSGPAPAGAPGPAAAPGRAVPAAGGESPAGTPGPAGTRTAPDRLDADRLDADRLDADRLDADPPDSDRPDSDRPDAGRLDSGQRGAGQRDSGQRGAGQRDSGQRDTDRLAARLWPLIRDVPDYPKPGVVFKDLTPLLADAGAFAAVVDALASPWLPAADAARVDKVVGIEARGFLLAAPVAYRLGAGFVPVRKAGKLPWTVRSASYSLEYGDATIELHSDAIAPGERVLVIDDVLATGGTAAATVGLVRAGGGLVVAVSVLLELTFLAGRAALPDTDVTALLAT